MRRKTIGHPLDRIESEIAVLYGIPESGRCRGFVKDDSTP